MICPRCSVGEISETTQECVVCGYSPTAGVLVDTPEWNDLEDPAVRSLDRQFRIEGVLRRSVVSSVYLARDLVSGRLAALKVLPLAPDYAPGLVDRFRQEAALAAALDHPHIVPVYHFGVTDACLWYTMEHCQSRSLGEVLRATGPMELRACLRLVEQVASALDYGHRRGVLHGSLKLSNVLVDADGWVRVADFGMHTAFGPLPPRKPDASIEESFGHIAPERLGSSPLLGPASDQYSLAILIYACLAGRQPFSGDTPEEIAREHLTTPPPRLADVRSGIPPHVTQAVARAMSKNPAERFPTILDFSTALAGVGISRFTPAGTAAVTAPATSPAVPATGPAPGPGPAPYPASDTLLLPDGEPEDAELPAALRLWPPRHPRLWIAAGIVLTVIFGGMLRLWSARAARARNAPAQQSWGSLDSTPEPAAIPSIPHASKPTAAPAPSRQTARLFINATPWGELSIDGRAMGNTPRADIPVSPGMHRIRVTRDGYQPWQRDVIVHSGDTLRLSDITLSELQP